MDSGAALRRGDSAEPHAALDLVAEGRLLDAIDVLTKVNRQSSDAHVEEILVGLRHEAFALLESNGATPPPIASSTQLPGPLPEVRPEQVDAASLRAGLASHGCVLVRGLIDREQAAGLVHGIDRALEAFDAALAGAPATDTAPWFSRFVPTAAYREKLAHDWRRRYVRSAGSVWTVDSPRMLFRLLDLIEETGISALVAAHLGERPALSALKCTLRRVPAATQTNWHQDGAFLGADVRTLNLWLSLSDCGVDAPGLDVLPRRLDEVIETGTHGAVFDWSVGPDLATQLAQSTPVIRPVFAPGDAMLFDHLCLHRTGVDPTMTRDRYAIETWFFAPSSYPDGQVPIVC